MKRCKWVNLKNESYVNYHDNEWGKPKYNDKDLFEILVLEIFQAGLSWECVLNKRKFFRDSFDDFDYTKIANYTEKKVGELLNNHNIIRNKLKINAVINNAKVFIEIKKEYKSFSNYIWKFTEKKVIKNKEPNIKVSSELSDEISKDLKKRGMKFVGTIIIYSYLQAIGIINDHELDCFCYKNP